MRALPLLLVALMGCSESEMNFRPSAPVPAGEASIGGQVCDDVRQVWLEGASVYTHLIDADGVAYDTRLTVTDTLGKWRLEQLPGDLDYTVYIAHRNEILQSFSVTVPAGEHVETPPPSCFGDVDLAVAVVTGGFDDLSGLFAALGIASYETVDGQVGDEITQFLSDPFTMANFQVVFFDGGHQEDGVIYSEVADTTVDTVLQGIRDYVNSGGTILATDWSYDVVERAFPDMIDFLGDDLIADSAQQGEPGNLTATVQDVDMANAIGAGQVEVVYDMSVWPLVESTSPDVVVHLAGDAPYRVGMDVQHVSQSPLLLSFEQGGGRVIFTTYRNSVNNSGDMLGILQYLLAELQFE